MGQGLEWLWFCLANPDGAIDGGFAQGAVFYRNNFAGCAGEFGFQLGAKICAGTPSISSKTPGVVSAAFIFATITALDSCCQLMARSVCFMVANKRPRTAGLL